MHLLHSTPILCPASEIWSIENRDSINIFLNFALRVLFRMYFLRSCAMAILSEIKDRHHSVACRHKVVNTNLFRDGIAYTMQLIKHIYVNFSFKPLKWASQIHLSVERVVETELIEETEEMSVCSFVSYQCDLVFMVVPKKVVVKIGDVIDTR